MRRLTLHVIGGARPNFMKVAPLVHALDAAGEATARDGVDLRTLVVHTGQHYDTNMSEVFFRDLGLRDPDRHLGVGSGTHSVQTAKVMMAYEEVALQDRPDLVVVVGDVNSTLACSLTASKLGHRVAHVEAGLRSFDMSMPEEINRKLTDAISDLLFVTEESGLRNLRMEGIAEEKVFLVGNVMIDTMMKQLARIENGSFAPAAALRPFYDRGEKYAVLTLHRPSNVDSPKTFSAIWGAIREVAHRIPILFPVHPRTMSRIRELGLDGAGVTLVEPVGYLDMLYAVRGSAMVITDSGGLQEETTALGIPCITVRENTERPSTVEMGTNLLAGKDPSSIIAAAGEILAGRWKKGIVPPLWDGHAAERIADVILRAILR
jgi:UDP-N-acetylglucosamine 2-epimerase (non-hydrolysing)